MQNMKRLNKISKTAVAMLAAVALTPGAHAQGIPIVTTEASPQFVPGNTLQINRVGVPGVGWFDLFLEWDGAGNWVVKAAQPCALCSDPTPPPVVKPPTTTQLRACKIQHRDAVLDIAVYADRLEFAVTATGNAYYFYPSLHYIIQSGESDSIADGTVFQAERKNFYWVITTAGFEGGVIPVGVTKKGTTQWNATWFQPQQQFLIGTLGEANKPC